VPDVFFEPAFDHPLFKLDDTLRFLVTHGRSLMLIEPPSLVGTKTD
jgi:hypothetical protein